MRSHLLGFLLSLVALLALAAPVLASEDPANPTPWTGVGLDCRNDGRAHVYYYRLAARHVRPPSRRSVKLRVFGEGSGQVVARLQDRAADPTRTYVTCEIAAGTPTFFDATSTSPVGVSPVLVVQVDASVTRWSVMVEDQNVRAPMRAPDRTPTGPAADAPIPPVPGGGTAAPWPAAGISEIIPEGFQPLYYWRDFSGGTATADMSITTSFSASCTVEVMAREAPPEAPYSIWTASHSCGSTDGNPRTQSWTDTGSVPAGRYLVRVTRESASRTSSWTLRLR